MALQLEQPRQKLRYAAALNAQHKMSTGGKTTSTGQNHFESELEINDFPQYARWKVTHKDQLQQINDFTGAVVTVKGTYYPREERFLWANEDCIY